LTFGLTAGAMVAAAIPTVVDSFTRIEQFAIEDLDVAWDRHRQLSAAGVS
jgi:hypothetical protein